MTHVMTQASITESCANNLDIKKVNETKYNFRNIPSSVHSNDLFLNDFENIIAHFLQNQSTQEGIGTLYENICNLCYDEINDKVKYLNINKQAKKGLKRKPIGFGNTEIED